MNSYSITYWVPGSTGTPSILSVNAAEFAFTETHALFMDDSRKVVLALPLTLQPMIRFVGPAA